MRIVLFSDLLDLTPPGEAVALIFTPGDRDLLVDALDNPGAPSLVREQLRQQLAGQRAGYTLTACHSENARLLARTGR